MESKELRIGNWVYNETTRENMQVYPMMIPQLNRLDGTSHNIKPIPLTEDILLKCGFEKVDKYGYFEHSNIIGLFTLFTNVDANENTIEYGIDSNTVCWINNLHQLQNLYFALTGKELEIKF